ncbi:MAG TPA: hypothetical protein VLM88_05065 [Proteiniclasticum sp.]|nr:hypothetical protein [Proteiniclasticum sp.]
MKKTAILLILSFLLLIAAGCSGKSDEQGSPENDVQQNEEVSVDKSLLNVEITLPPDFTGDMSGFDKEVYLDENPGIKDVELLENGSMKLTMSRAKHKEIMEEMEESILTTFNELMTDEESSYIKDIRASNDYKKVDVIVDREGYENAFDFSSMTIMFSVGFYHVFEGSDFELVLRYIDEATEEVIEELHLPEE